MWLAAGLDEPSGSPRIRDWTGERAELTVISDLLMQLIGLVDRIVGGDASPKPRPRPVTAFDRATSRHVRAEHLALVQRLLPDT